MLLRMLVILAGVAVGFNLHPKFKINKIGSERWQTYTGHPGAQNATLSCYLSHNETWVCREDATFAVDADDSY